MGKLANCRIKRGERGDGAKEEWETNQEMTKIQRRLHTQQRWVRGGELNTVELEGSGGGEISSNLVGEGGDPNKGKGDHWDGPVVTGWFETGKKKGLRLRE